MKRKLRYSHIKTLVPVGIKRFPDNAGSVGLFCIDSDHSEGVREAENLAFG